MEVGYLGENVKRTMNERIVVPTVLYGVETWSLNAKEKRRLNEMKINCLRSICGVTIRDRIRNSGEELVC